MQADWLECEVEAFLGRLAGDPSCEPTALLEGLLAGYATSGHHNKLSSQSVSRLYALAGLALAKQGAAGAPELMKIAMALSPYDTEYPIHYDAMLDRARAGTARPMILIVSCEKYAARGLRQADRLSELGGVGARIVVGRDAHFPDDPRVLRVAADDSYEALPAKISAALVNVYETLPTGTTVLKLDDDVPVRDPAMLEASLLSMARSGVQYAGRRLEGPDLDRIWHWGKCSVPDVDTRIYGGHHEGGWAGGTAYFLGARGLRWFALSSHRFPDLARNAIYEDRLIGEVMALGGQTLRAVDLRAWGLDLPADVESPALDQNLWARLERAWQEAKSVDLR